MGLGLRPEGDSPPMARSHLPLAASCRQVRCWSCRLLSGPPPAQSRTVTAAAGEPPRRSVCLSPVVPCRSRPVRNPSLTVLSVVRWVLRKLTLRWSLGTS